MNKKYMYFLFILLFFGGTALGLQNKKTIQIKSIISSKNKSDKKSPKFKYAIFDISGCFWDKSLYELLYSYQKTRGVPLSYYFKMVKFGVLHLMGTLNAQEAYESFLSYCRGMQEKDVKDSCLTLWNKKCKKSIFVQAKKLFERHKNDGVVTILTEAGLKEIYSEFVNAYEFDYLCTSELEYKDGVVTGRLIGKPCTGEEKLRKVSQIIEKKLGGSLKEAVFYATSHNDIPLLEKVGKQVIINPTSKLQSYAKKKGWEILKFKKT